VVEILSVEEPEPATEIGLKVTVAPVGNPLALKETFALKPLSGLTVMVLLKLLPGFTVSELGDADIVKSTGAVTTKLTLAVWVKLPLVLAIVRV